MKKTILSTLICISCSSMALTFAQTPMNTPNNLNNPNDPFQYQVHPTHHQPENMQYQAPENERVVPEYQNPARYGIDRLPPGTSEEMIREDRQQDRLQQMEQRRRMQQYNEQTQYQEGRYDIALQVETDGNPKNYQVFTDRTHGFVIVNSEEVTYVKNKFRTRDGKKIANTPTPEYGKVSTGMVIRGSATAAMDMLTDVHLTVTYNDLVGFQSSCHGATCVDVPQELLRNYDVKVQAPFNQVTKATEFKNSKGQRIIIRLVVLPVNDTRPPIPDPRYDNHQMDRP